MCLICSVKRIFSPKKVRSYFMNKTKDRFGILVASLTKLRFIRFFTTVQNVVNIVVSDKNCI